MFTGITYIFSAERDRAFAYELRTGFCDATRPHRLQNRLWVAVYAPQKPQVQARGDRGMPVYAVYATCSLLLMLHLLFAVYAVYCLSRGQDGARPPAAPGCDTPT